jgi:hypothetical protein
MYKKENNSFINSLYEEIYDEAFEYLKSISNF